MDVVRRGSSIQELSCKVALDLEEIKEAIDRFGIPKDWTSITYRESTELAKKQKELQDKSLLHGIVMSEKDNQYTVDYAWVANESTSKFHQTAKTIRSAARNRGYRSTRELVGAFASFVQSLECRIPPDHRRSDVIAKKFLLLVQWCPSKPYPNKWGGYDSKSMLFAALVHSIDLVRISFSTLNDHIFAAVQLSSPKAEDHYYQIQGVRVGP